MFVFPVPLCRVHLLEEPMEVTGDDILAGCPVNATQSMQVLSCYEHSHEVGFFKSIMKKFVNNLHH